MYGEGISHEGDLIDMGIAANLVEKTGAWISYGDLRIGQGRENAKQFLKENRDLAVEIDTKLRKHLNLAAAPPAAEKPVAAAPEPAREKEKVRK